MAEFVTAAPLSEIFVLLRGGSVHDSARACSISLSFTWQKFWLVSISSPTVPGFNSSKKGY